MNTELIWQHQESAGWEHVRVIEDHPGWTVFDSILVREHAGQVLRGGYTLVIDKSWHTLELRLMIETSPGAMEGIHLLTEGDGRWTDAEEQPIPELDGCLDVDIQWTPLTNSLPVNRLQLEQCDPQEIRVAYISLPDLALTVVGQRYERMDDTHVQYTSAMHSQPYTIEVDQDGIVTHYPERFARTWPR